MKLARRDPIATVCVAVGTLAAVMWLAGVGSQGITAARVVTGILLALGFVASASAVVPGFLDLLHGSKLYVATTSVLGLAALVAGIFALIDGEEAMLGALVGVTVVLWAISTWHHMRLAGGRTPAAT